MKGQQLTYAVQLYVRIVYVYHSFQNGAVIVMVSGKYYDNFEYIFIMNVESTA